MTLNYHNWLNNRESSLLGPLASLHQNYLKENYSQDSNNFFVENVVHIESASTKYALQEVEWLEKHYGNDSFLGAIVGGVDFMDENLESTLDFYRHQSKVKGVRQLLNWHKKLTYTAADRQNDLSNSIWMSRFALLKKYNLSFDMQICPEQMIDAVLLLQKFPDIMVVVNHAGMPIQEDMDIWRKSIVALSRCHNVHIKLSGFGMLDHYWDGESIAPLIEHVINSFGTNRCMFASNFPVDKLYSTYDNLMQSYIDIANRYFYQDISKLFYNNAKTFYKL